MPAGSFRRRRVAAGVLHRLILVYVFYYLLGLGAGPLGRLDVFSTGRRRDDRGSNLIDSLIAGDPEPSSRRSSS